MEQANLLDFIVLNLGHARTVHHWCNEDISSPFIRIYYVKEGRAYFHLPSGDIELTSGHMYMVPSYVPHSYECEPNLDFYYLFVYQRMVSEINLFDIYDFPIEVKSNEAANLLFENYCSLYPQLNLPSRDATEFANHQSYRDYAMAYMKMPFYERMQLHGLVEILFSYFMKHAKQKSVVKDSRIAELLNYIQQHISDVITIDDLADKACLTKSHLIRSFSRTMGITPLQYILRKKIQHAQSLLLSTDMTVNRISEATGFNDVSYFIRLFKKNIGFTPQEYREKLIG